MWIYVCAFDAIYYVLIAVFAVAAGAVLVAQISTSRPPPTPAERGPSWQIPDPQTAEEQQDRAAGGCDAATGQILGQPGYRARGV
jgi:hypothetical protein